MSQACSGGSDGRATQWHASALRAADGLAEYFEVGRGRRGFNQTHVDFLTGQLAVGGWQTR